MPLGLSLWFHPDGRSAANDIYQQAKTVTRICCRREYEEIRSCGIDAADRMGQGTQAQNDDLLKSLWLVRENKAWEKFRAFILSGLSYLGEK